MLSNAKFSHGDVVGRGVLGAYANTEQNERGTDSRQVNNDSFAGQDDDNSVASQDNDHYVTKQVDDDCIAR